MALVGISKAAKLVNKDRGTITRYLEKGKLSATLNAAGKREIDTAELQRVFGPLSGFAADTAAPAAAVSSTIQQQEMPDIVALLKGQIAELKAEKEELKAEKKELLELLKNEQQERQQLAIAAAKPAQEKPGFWRSVARMFQGGGREEA